MKRNKMILAVALIASLCWAGLALAQDKELPAGHPPIDKTADSQEAPIGHFPTDKPADAKQLPAGHPPMSGAGGGGQLPAGHPPMGGAGGGGQLPAGHPPMSGAGGGGQLPAGHPPMDGGGGQLPSGHPPMGGAGGNTGGGMSIGRGTIIVKITQGTEGGTKAVGSEVMLNLIFNGRAINTQFAKITEGGLAMFEDVGVTAPSRPVVSMNYKGVLYEAVGKQVTPQDPDGVVALPIYEPTETEPAWKVTNRHVMLQPMPGGVVVNDIMTITNPAGHSWLGKKLDEPIKTNAQIEHVHDHISLSIPVPANATRIQLAPEFSACCSTQVDGQVIHYGPMQPGDHSYRMAYVVPVKDGKLDLSLVANGPTDRIMVFLTDAKLKVTAKGLEAGQPMNNGKVNVLTYQAENLKAGQTVSLELKGFPEEQPGKSADAQPQGQIKEVETPKSVRYLAGIGGGAILVLGTITMLSLQPKPKES